MAYLTPAARNAYQRTWRAHNRAARAFAGLCRDCPRPCSRVGDRQRVLCAHCSRKSTQRRPDALEVLNALKREQRAQLRTYLQPLRVDRRQGGRHGAALAWALESRRA